MGKVNRKSRACFGKGGGKIRWKCVLTMISCLAPLGTIFKPPWDHLQAEQRSTNEHVNLQSPFVSIPPTGAPTKRR